MLEIVLCDDHVSFRQELEGKIKDIIEYTRNDSKMKIYILETKFDGSMNGIELALEIRNHDSRGVIIFLTVDSLDKLSMFKYHIEVMDVIDKEDDNYLIRLEKCLLRGNKRCGVKKNNLHKFLKVYIRGVATKAIPIRNIISIETLNAGCGSIIYLKDKTTIRYSKSLKYVLDKFAYVTQEGVAVVSKEGKLITTWGADNFDDAMNLIVEQLFGK